MPAGARVAASRFAGALRERPTARLVNTAQIVTGTAASLALLYKADVGRSKLPRSRGRDRDEADDREDRAAGDLWALVNHEARCGPMDEAGTLADPQQSHQHCDEAQDQ